MSELVSLLDRAARIHGPKIADQARIRFAQLGFECFRQSRAPRAAVLDRVKDARDQGVIAIDRGRYHSELQDLDFRRNGNAPHGETGDWRREVEGLLSKKSAE